MAAAKDKKPVMDVSKPGKSPADATTRPIITGHEMIKDPMVTEDKAPMEGVTEDVPGSDTEEKPMTSPIGKKVIQPLSADEEKPEQTEEPAQEEKPEEEKAESSEEKSEEKKEEAPVTEDAVVDAVLDQVGDKKEETKESEEERKRQEIVDKLVEDKKYFVPIGQVHKRRNNRIALLVLGALLPVLVGLGLAADAGAINLGFKVPFDFIKDKPVASVPTQTTTTTTTQQPKTTTSQVVIDTSASTTLKDFTDTTKIYSVKYPSNWVAKAVEPLSSEQATPGVLASGVTFIYPNAVSESGVHIVAGNGSATYVKTQEKYWSDNKLVPQQKMINGYTVRFVHEESKTDTESYTDSNYLFVKGDYHIYLSFREKYSRQTPAENWDASKALPGFETILNSIKFLK